MERDERENRIEGQDPSARRDGRRLWLDYVGGDPLSGEELGRLSSWLEDEELRDAFLADLETDRELRALAPLAAGHERFVEETLARLEFEKAQGTSPRPARAAKRGGSGAATPASDPGLPHHGPRSRWGWLRSPATPLAAAAGILIGLALGPLGKWGDGRQSAQPPSFASVLPASSGEFDAGMEQALRRVGRGPIETSEGGMRLAFDSGAVVDVDASARIELIDEDEVVVLGGRAVASIPSNLAAFVVRTPTMRLSESGTEYELTVGLDGATHIRLLDGTLSVEPGREGAWAGHGQTLSVHSLREARVLPMLAGVPRAPLVLEAEDELGAFSGAIVAEGEALEFGRRESLEKARGQVLALFEQDPDVFSTRWHDVARAASPVDLTLKGIPHLRQIRIDELDDLLHTVLLQVHDDLGEGTGSGGAERDPGHQPSYSVGIDLHGPHLQALIHGSDAGRIETWLPVLRKLIGSEREGDGTLPGILYSGDGVEFRFEHIRDLTRHLESRVEGLREIGIHFHDRDGDHDGHREADHHGERD